MQEHEYLIQVLFQKTFEPIDFLLYFRAADWMGALEQSNLKRREVEGVVQPSRRYEKKGDVFFALMYKIKSVSNTEFSIETHFVVKIF